MLIRKDLEFQDRESCQCDPVGRYFNKLQDRLDGIASSPEQKVLIGGDLNVTFDSNLDCLGGSPAQKESAKLLEEICFHMDLVDT